MMLKKLFPLSYCGLKVSVSAILYFVIYFGGSLIKGTVDYFTDFDLAAGIFGMAVTVYVFIGLLLLSFRYLGIKK